jgi:hypothetical protein
MGIQDMEQSQVGSAVTLKPFFQQAQQEYERKQELAKLTRQQAFDRGLITVQDLDDEELRAGRCRDELGRIPRNKNKTEPVPRDIHDEIIAEHEARWNQNLREKLDTMTEVIAGVALDDTAEPRDRMEAAKWIIERVAGKAPERVNVTVNKLPWEEMIHGIAKRTKAEHDALKAGTIDAEVVDVPTGESGPGGLQGPDEFVQQEAQVAGESDGPNGSGGVPRYEFDPTDGPVDDYVPPAHIYTQEVRYPHAPPAPSQQVPANSMSIAPGPQIERPETWPDEGTSMSWDEIDSKIRERAEGRKQKDDIRKQAKKRRIVKRTLGYDAIPNNLTVAANEHEQDNGRIKVTFDLQKRDDDV